MHLAQADQFSGSLIGQCLGDALGFPVEGSPPDICASYVEQLRTLGIDHTVARRRNYALGPVHRRFPTCARTHADLQSLGVSTRPTTPGESNQSSMKIASLDNSR